MVIVTRAVLLTLVPLAALCESVLQGGATFSSQAVIDLNLVCPGGGVNAQYVSGPPTAARLTQVAADAYGSGSACKLAGLVPPPENQPGFV
jgi:hypothetical protein